MFYVIMEGFMSLDFSIFLSTFPFFRDRSARRLDSRLGGPRFSLFVRRRGRLNPRKFHGDLLLDYWITEGFRIFIMSTFSFSEAGVPAGWTRVSEGLSCCLFEQRPDRRKSGCFSGELCAGSLDFYFLGFCTSLGDGEAD